MQNEAFVALVNYTNGTQTRNVFRHHDTINRGILGRTRCKTQGYAVYCPVCSGRGSVNTEPAVYVKLVLWLLHPRKGASRGIVIQRIEQSDLPAAGRSAQCVAGFRPINRRGVCDLDGGECCTPPIRILFSDVVAVRYGTRRSQAEVS